MFRQFKPLNSLFYIFNLAICTKSSELFYMKEIPFISKNIKKILHIKTKSYSILYYILLLKVINNKTAITNTILSKYFLL